MMDKKLQQATEELWAKIQDMQEGTSLSLEEWLEIIRRVLRRLSTKVSE